MLSIKNADIFKANFYYYYPVIITMTLLILQTPHTDEMVCLVTAIRKNPLVSFSSELNFMQDLKHMRFLLGTNIS